MSEIAKIREKLRQHGNIGHFKMKQYYPSPSFEVQILGSGILITKWHNPEHIEKFLLTDVEAIFVTGIIEELLLKKEKRSYGEGFMDGINAIRGCNEKEKL